jgi:hypothetical protein
LIFANRTPEQDFEAESEFASIDTDPPSELLQGVIGTAVVDQSLRLLKGTDVSMTKA